MKNILILNKPGPGAEPIDHEQVMMAAPLEEVQGHHLHRGCCMRWLEREALLARLLCLARRALLADLADAVLHPRPVVELSGGSQGLLLTLVGKMEQMQNISAGIMRYDNLAFIKAVYCCLWVVIEYRGVFFLDFLKTYNIRFEKIKKSL